MSSFDKKFDEKFDESVKGVGEIPRHVKAKATEVTPILRQVPGQFKMVLTGGPAPALPHFSRFRGGRQRCRRGAVLGPRSAGRVRRQADCP